MALKKTMPNTDQEAEIVRLKKINQALITRIEAGPNTHVAYDSFAHSVFLADKVRDRTAALNQALQELTQSNRQLLQAQTAAQLANTSRSKLMTAISHDIMQPVCAAQLLVNTLTVQLEQGQKNYQLQALGQAISDIEGLLQSLLDYARHDLTESQPELQATPLHDILQGLAIESAPLASNKGLSFDYEPSTAVAITDASLLARILRNLISNAIRYTLQGSIKVTAKTFGDEVIISVIDTGIGIQENYPREILQAFQKSTNNTNHEGLGLGLANVNTLCQLLKHDLQYQSQVNQGSCFSITLASATPKQKARQVATHSPTVSFDNHVLIVDNVPSVCSALGGLLDTWGAQTDCCTDVQTLTKQRLARAQIILLDYHLGDKVTGLDIISRWSITCPVLFMTASNDPQDLRLIESAGYAYIKKPIRPAHLRRALETVLGN